MTHTHANTGGCVCVCACGECIAVRCLAPSCMQHDLRVSIVTASCCTFCARLLFTCRALPFRTLPTINIRQCNAPSPASRALRLTHVALSPLAAAQLSAGDSSFQVLFAATFIAIFTKALEGAKDHSSIVPVLYPEPSAFISIFENIFSN